MQTLKYLTQVDQRGSFVLRDLPLEQGADVEVIALPCEESDGDDLLRAAETSLSFWDNPIGEVWNDA